MVVLTVPIFVLSPYKALARLVREVMENIASPSYKGTSPLGIYDYQLRASGRIWQFGLKCPDFSLVLTTCQSQGVKFVKTSAKNDLIASICYHN